MFTKNASFEHETGMAPARGPLVVAMSGAFRSACACWRASEFAGCISRFHARDPGGQFRRQQPVVRRRRKPSSLVSSERDALGRVAPPATPRRAENQRGARGSALRNRRHYTDSSAASARRAAAVASGVDPPEQRPFAERRHRAPARRTAVEHGEDGADAPALKAAFSVQLSALSVLALFTLAMPAANPSSQQSIVGCR